MREHKEKASLIPDLSVDLSVSSLRSVKIQMNDINSENALEKLKTGILHS